MIVVDYNNVVDYNSDSLNMIAWKDNGHQLTILSTCQDAIHRP
jgi:hypothetical protein